MTSTRVPESAESRFASTHPAEPAPTMTKSYSASKFINCSKYPNYSGAMQFGVGALLQFLEGEAGDHVGHDKARRGHVNDGQVDVDALDATRCGQRVGAAAQQSLFAVPGVVLHDHPDAAGTGRQIHRAADRRRVVVL